MTPVPFHRRIFLWVFILAFVFLAPAVVFYTAGYRWNQKKGIIERNGTLILDSVPPGASISLNGEIISDQTPVTLQNVAPGTYTIRFERPGYSAWEKTLDVRPSRVTFVNDVQLWKLFEPAFSWEGSVRSISASPDGQAVALVEDGPDRTQFTFRDLPSDVGSVSEPPQLLDFEQPMPEGPVRILWNDVSSAVLVQDSEGHAWMAGRSAQGSSVTALSDGVWRWEGGTLVGIGNGERREIVARTGVASRTALPPGTLDQLGTYAVVSASGTSRLSVVEDRRGDRRFELPDGNWTFVRQEGSWIFLTNGSEWLGFDPGDATASVVRVPAAVPPVFMDQGRETIFFSRSGGELWFGTLGLSPELLLRSSEPLTGAELHQEGGAVFYATEHSIVALGLDPRDGRLQTTLAAFDQMNAMTMTEGILYVAGQRDGQRGVWRIEVE